MSNKIYRLCLVLITLSLGVTACQSLFSESHITPAPTPGCVKPFLTVGTLLFDIDSIPREANSFPEIPAKPQDMAYWVEGTNVNFVFGLSPTKENLSLNTVLKTGDLMVINWADCTNERYVLKSMETVKAGDTSIFDQTTGGITIYVQDEASTLVIRGERPIVPPAETSTPLPADAILVDLQILEFTEPNDQTIQFRIMLTNQSARAITLTEDDIALITANGSEVSPQSIEPVLPQELSPGDILPLTLTFPKPEGNSAVLRIFDVTFEYYF